MVKSVLYSYILFKNFVPPQKKNSSLGQKTICMEKNSNDKR